MWHCICGAEPFPWAQNIAFPLRMVSTLTVLHEKHYQQVPLKDLKEQFGAQKFFPAAEWRKLFADGTVTKWLATTEA